MKKTERKPITMGDRKGENRDSPPSFLHIGFPDVQDQNKPPLVNYYRLSLLALVLSVVVIMLGAYTRLTDAGLGCPDWPGCYGQMVLPNSSPGLAQAQQTFPGLPIVTHKAWTEMVHRYVAGTLGTFIVILAFWAVCRRFRRQRQPIVAPLLLIGLLAFQVVLGMWTVTLKVLPFIVTLHLLGGMAIASILGWLTFSTKPNASLFYVIPAKNTEIQKLQPWIVLGLIILIVQIFLGAWTSTNYAALACPDFPYCQGKWLPNTDWHSAFNILSPIGPNYEGGRLAMAARVTIHLTHRYWAFLTFFYLLPIALILIWLKKYSALKKLGIMLLVLLMLQIGLGIINEVKLLPLAVAVSHNGVAVLLLLTTIAITRRVFSKEGV